MAAIDIVIYHLIRRFPTLFYSLVDWISKNGSLFQDFILMTGEMPNLITAYTHITTLYLIISKGTNSRFE